MRCSFATAAVLSGCTLGAGVGCGRDAVDAPPLPLVEIAPPAATAPAAATAPSASSAAAAAEAVARCLAAVERAGAMPSGEAERAARHLLVECASLYAAEPCREAHLLAGSPLTDPSQRIRIYTEGCKRAYCPILPEPRPAMCSAPPDLAAEARASLWRELREAIVRHDHGAAAVERLRAVEPAHEGKTVVRISREGARSLLELEVRGRPMRLYLDHPGAEAELVKALHAAGPPAGLVLISDANTPHRDVVVVLDAARQAGVTDIALQVKPGP